VVVHGGGKVISEWMERQGVRPRFIRGLRVTDEASMQIVVAVLTGVVNKSIVASVLSIGGRAIGLSGVDGGILQAEVMDPEMGRVGRVVEVNPVPMRVVVQAGFIPVIAPVAVFSAQATDSSGSMLNVNADTAAGEIAAALEAERLVVLTDVEGVLDSSRRRIPRLTKRQAEGLMRSRVVDGGMVPKLEACITALGKVREAHIVDGRKPGALQEVLAGEALGTRVG
jgi:acetylglutamate kinase